MFADDEAPDDLQQESLPEDGEDEDFESMLEESFEPTSHKEGEMIEGIVVSVGREVAFVDVGGKGEATINLEELVDPDGKLDVR